MKRWRARREEQSASADGDDCAIAKWPKGTHKHKLFRRLNCDVKFIDTIFRVMRMICISRLSMGTHTESGGTRLLLHTTNMRANRVRLCDVSAWRARLMKSTPIANGTVYEFSSRTQLLPSIHSHCAVCSMIGAMSLSIGDASAYCQTKHNSRINQRRQMKDIDRRRTFGCGWQRWFYDFSHAIRRLFRFHVLTAIIAMLHIATGGRIAIFLKWHVIECRDAMRRSQWNHNCVGHIITAIIARHNTTTIDHIADCIHCATRAPFRP